MPNTVKIPHGSATAQPKNITRQRGHVIPRKPVIDLNGPGRLRSAHVLALLGVSHSTMYERLKVGNGSFPVPDGKDGGRNYWNTSTIRDFLAENQSGGILEGGVR